MDAPASKAKLWNMTLDDDAMAMGGCSAAAWAQHTQSDGPALVLAESRARDEKGTGGTAKLAQGTDPKCSGLGRG